MTTLGNEILRDTAETTKNRAHAIKSRLEEMGYKAPLSHAYEILATSRGYRNWPTMKSTLDKIGEVVPSDERSAVQRPRFGDVQGSTNSKVIMRSMEEEEKLVWTPQERLDKGSAIEITTWVIGKIEDKSSWGAEWKGRAVALLFGIIETLVYLRDQKGVDLDVKNIRDHLALDRYVKFAWGTVRSDVPNEIRCPISNYLNSGGYVDAGGRDQSDTIVEVHGFLEELISDALAMIETDLKWHAFKVKRHSVG